MGEQGHWYSPLDGSLVSGVPYADRKRAGELRPPTLRDARTLGLKPSVTTIMQLLDRPALRTWSVRHAVEAAVRTMRAPGESPDELVKRIVQVHEEYAEEAAAQGTRVHYGLSCALQEVPLPWSVDLEDMYEVVEQFLPWYKAQDLQLERSEHSFLSPLGYAGTVDWMGTWNGHSAIADFKTQDFSTIKDARFYDEHALQLSGYAVGTGRQDHKRLSIILSRTVPGLVAFHEWPDARKWDEKWLSLWNLWQLMKDWLPVSELEESTFAP